ncbi:hypothetical protein CBD41_04255 [bacterium TMED181]|nr:hypothetical protein [Planctomycetota bacterium]OUW45240.1 MAG: hypothetical protein CBD41_04255 [bacterium TMED181]
MSWLPGIGLRLFPALDFKKKLYAAALVKAVGQLGGTPKVDLYDHSLGSLHKANWEDEPLGL